MTYETKTIGHLVVRVPITRTLGTEDGELITSFAFDPFQLLSENLDVEYLGQFLHLLAGEGNVETMLDYTDRSELVRELLQSLEHKLVLLKKS